METTLTQLQQLFADWRSSSTKKRYSNSSLRNQAVKCLSHYTHREISEAIGISITTLRLWQASFHRDQEIIDSPSEFVAINLSREQIADDTRQASLDLQISLPNGILIKIESISVASSVAFVTALNEESHSCSI